MGSRTETEWRATTTTQTVADRAAFDRSLAVVDGKLGLARDASIPVTDEGLLRGDGAFEVIRLYAGRPFALDEHLDRLSRSAQRLRLDYPASGLRDDIGQLLEAAGDIDAALRVLVTRGGHRIAIIEQLNAMPATIALTTVRYAPLDVMRGVKSLSYAANMLVRRIASEAGTDDALLVTPHDEVLEGPTSSFFCVLDGSLYTPPLTSGILDSITRRHLLQVTDASQRIIRRSDIPMFAEAFLASTAREVHPVNAIDGSQLPMPPGPRTVDAARKLRAHIEESLHIAPGERPN